MISRALRLGSSAWRARQDGFDAQGHRGQGIVQFVGDAGGQLAYTGQLGGMPKLLGHGPDFFVGSFLLGDVAGDRRGADDLPRGVLDRRNGQGNVDALAVLFDPDRFIMIDLSPRLILQG